MADSTRIPGEQVKCHECSNVWPRNEGGLQCPRCESEFVEILSDSTPSSPALPPRSDSFNHMHMTRSRSVDSLDHHHPWHNVPDQDDDDDREDLPLAGGRSQPRGYHWESRSPTGSSSFSISMVSSNGGPMRITTNRGRGGGPNGDPVLREVEHGFGDLVSTLLGIMPQQTPENRGMTAAGPPLPGSPFATTGRHQPQGQLDDPMMEMLGTFVQGIHGTRGHEGANANMNPFAILQRMMDPANAASGDAVFSQEALDRIVTQLMDRDQTSNAPGPATEAAIRSLPNKKVEREMLDDHGKAECSICMDSVEIGDQVTVLPCTHWFHETCITAWLKEHDTCPHCRKGISSQPEATGNASRGTGQPSRLPRRTSSGHMPGGWQERSTTSRSPVAAIETSSGPQDVRAARERYYSDQQPEDLERRDTQGRRFSRSTPSSPANVRRHHRSESNRSSSNVNSNGGGRLGGWVRSFGSSGDR